MSHRQDRACMSGRRTISHGGVCAATLLALCCSFASAQTASPAKPAKAPGYYLDPSVLKLASLLPAPSAFDSKATQAELALLHQVEAARTPAQVAAAKTDDAEEDIFSFRNVLGPAFDAAALPLTAALSTRVHGEESVASLDLKAIFPRPRPYQSDKTLHPVCKLSDAPNSYPSGHTISGYLLAYTLAEMAPEKKQQILERADDYAHNRLICGVHYPSDLEASRRVALAVFGAMMTNPKFVDDLNAASTELHIHLGASLATK